MSVLGSLDRSADMPIFQQIAEHLRSGILDGTFGPGERLPSETVLQEHYGVARMTVRQALNSLKDQGLVVSEHGRGSFVRPTPVVRRVASDRFARQHRQEGKAAFLAEAEGVGVASVDQIEVSYEHPPDHVREVFGLQANDKVLARHRRYLIDGAPVELASSYIPSALARGTAMEQPETGPGGVYARLEEIGHTLGEFTEDVSARMPSPEERRRLQLTMGSPVLIVQRVAYTETGRPVELTDTIKSGKNFVLAYRFPAQ